MENLEQKTQMIVVKKVLEEMQKAEQYVEAWNASWYEQLLDAHLPLHYEICDADVRDMENKYEPKYKLTNYSKESIGIPLVKETLVGNNTLTGEENIKFECEFGRIDWYGMFSHKATRHFSFNNNGTINFSKDIKRKQTLQHPKRISYETSFNVLSNDFDISIIHDQLDDDLGKEHKKDYFTISLKENILIEKFNDIEIIRDLITGMKLVKIAKKYDKKDKQNNATVVLEVTLNQDDSLEVGAVTINTYKGNGKVNGTYRFDVSRKKGVRANFYSRKGVKIDLKNNSMLSNNAKTLLPTPNSQIVEDVIVSDFANSTQKAIAKNLSDTVISFDNSDFNIEAVKQAEAKIIEMVKCIRGELPLFGLIERIDNCLSLIDIKKQLKITNKAKTLEFEISNN